MALRPLLLAAVFGIAAAGAFHAPAAQARGYVSISVGTPYYGNQYRHGDRYGNRYDDRYQSQRHRPGYVWVPAHWVQTYHGRVWVPGQYVMVRGYRHDRRYGYDGYGGYGNRVIHRAPRRVVPRPYYPPGYLSPFEDRRPGDW